MVEGQDEGRKGRLVPQEMGRGAGAEGKKGGLGVIIDISWMMCIVYINAITRAFACIVSLIANLLEMIIH